MAGNFFRGTTAEQDPRWGDSEKKLLVAMTRSGKFPAIYESKVILTPLRDPHGREVLLMRCPSPFF